MMLTTRTLKTITLGCLLGAAPPLMALSQDEGPRPPIDIEDIMPGGEAKGGEEEMIQLFQSVERRLKDMGDYLLGAGAGDTSALSKIGEAGIEELLRSARPNRPESTGSIADLLSVSKAEGQKVLEDIDRILEIAQQNGGT